MKKRQKSYVVSLQGVGGGNHCVRIADVETGDWIAEVIDKNGEMQYEKMATDTFIKGNAIRNVPLKSWVFYWPIKKTLEIFKLN